MTSLNSFCFFFLALLVEYSSSSEVSDVYRLPNDAIPISYDLRIAPRLENWTFVGEVTIRIHVKFTTDRIILHSRNLEIRNVTVKTSDNSINGTAYHTIATYDVDEKNQILVLRKGHQFQYNTDYDVSIAFHGNITYLSSNDSSCEGFCHESELGAFTYIEPTGARAIFPCFDEPRFRAPFTISVARPENYTVVSNMPSEDVLPSDSLSGGLIWEKFKPTPPMPTYLVAFVVSVLESLKNDDGRLRVMTDPELINNASYALKQADKLLKYFEGYLGIPYALPKLDLVTVSNHLDSAMENWGLITYEKDVLLLRDNNSADQKRIITSMLSHEFAHLWFGDMITIPWYDYLWLKEAFATYFQYFGAAAIEPSWNIETVFVLDILQTALAMDIGRPMTAQIRQFENISSTYDEISYQKGACVVRMFELMFSPSTFQNALHNYLKNGEKNQNGVTTPRNLFDAFDQQVELDSLSHLPPHASASDIMKTWTENEGYPVINVARSDKGEVIITQNPFKPNRSAKQAAKWIVPLTYTTESQPQFSDLLPTHWSFADNPTVLSGFNDSEWVLFNLKQSGYYRVNYDEKNWKLLIFQLVTNHTVIHPLNRAKLIDDAIALAVDGKLKYSVLFSLLEYLRNETNLVPYYTAVSSYYTLMDDFSGTNRTSQFIENFFKELLTNPFKQIACDDVSSKDDYLVQILKPSFLLFCKNQGFSCTSSKN